MLSFEKWFNVVKCKKVNCNNDCGVQNDKPLGGHCTSERRARKRDKKVRGDVI